MSGTGSTSGILIVDDQPVALGILEHALKQEDYQVYAATSGEEAMQLAFQKRPDLIILDMTMPGTDGLEVCRALKANTDTQDSVVIFLSAVVDAEVKAEGFDLGAVDYIQKPFDPAELRARVQAHLRLKDRLDVLREQFRELSEKVQKNSSGPSIHDTAAHVHLGVARESKTIRFQTDVEKVQGVVNQLLVGIEEHLCTKLRNDLALGIHEMVLNAVEHGNLGITSEEKSAALEDQTFGALVRNLLSVPELASRSVTVEYEFDGEIARYRIIDEGAGFEWSRFLERDEPEDLLASNGRGILISRYIFDRIEYNETGNEVFVEKRIASPVSDGQKVPSGESGEEPVVV